jgi:hypothetical protein
MADPGPSSVEPVRAGTTEEPQASTSKGEDELLLKVLAGKKL